MNAFFRSLRIACRHSRSPRILLQAYDSQSSACCRHSYTTPPLAGLARRSLFSSAGGGDNDPHAAFKEQMEQLKEERQELFGFTDEEHSAWSNAAQQGNAHQLPASLMQSVEQARAEAAQPNFVFPSSDYDKPQDGQDSNIPNDVDYQPSHGLTHLSEDGSSVNMVDVGHKTATKRMARAETRMILPPEVLEAFRGSNTSELVGPKGPIFATAKIAGIMAAK